MSRQPLCWHGLEHCEKCGVAKTLKAHATKHLILAIVWGLCSVISFAIAFSH